MPAEKPFTRLTLFVPGTRDLEGSGVPGEWIDNPKDGSFADSFAFGTVDDDVVAKIDAAPGAWLVQLTDDLRVGREAVVKTVETLRTHGAIAVRLEQSKLGWAVDKFLEVVSRGNPWALHRTAVTMLTEKDHVVSCGMHAFSLPDARIELKKGELAEVAQELLSTLNVYQIGEDPLLLSGQTFAPDAATPRRVVQRWPDDGYPPDHWCHNAYGVWHVGPPGGKARPLPELHSQFIPALVVMLTALEAKNGKLTREQVEKVRDEAPCMAVKHEDAKQLERARGYADIDPELAWEQWCVVAANRG